MNITIQKYDAEVHQPILAKWWDQHDYVPVPADITPPTTYIGYVGDKPVMAVSAFLTNSSMAFLENFISNPEASDEERGNVLKYGLEVIEGELRALGYKYFWAFSTQPALSRYYTKLGFKEMQTLHCSMARKI